LSGGVEWDERKATANLRKHGVDFADAALVLYDDLALTTQDPGDYGEERLATVGLDPLGRILVVVYTWREQRARIIFRTPGHSSRTKAVREQEMKREYDFSAAIRGPVLSLPPGKTRITIRIDDDVLQWFRQQVHGAGGGNYQTLMNAALREYVERRDHGLEDALRVVIRQELGRYEVKRVPVARARSNKRMQRTSGASRRRGAARR
jgi:uncharacterized DUF497 family protein